MNGGGDVGHDIHEPLMDMQAPKLLGAFRFVYFLRYNRFFVAAWELGPTALFLFLSLFLINK